MCLTDDKPLCSRRTLIGAGLTLPWIGVVRAAPSRELRGLELTPFKYEREQAPLDAFLAYPKDSPRAPIVVVLHGNAGLPEDVKDTAVWLATLGFVGFAVNPTSREPDPRTIPRALLAGREFGDRYVADARAGLDSLRRAGVGDSQLGVVGYCGGGYTALLWGAASFGAEIDAFVGVHTPFHNRNPDGSISTSRPQGLDLYREMGAPAQLHFGDEDGYTPKEDVREVQQLARARGKPLEVFTYAGADHGFALFTDAAYAPEAALEVERRAGRFLRERFKG